MNGIIGMTELALETELTTEQHEYLSMVKTSADSLLTVINDILDFSKIEAGKLELDTTTFNLRDHLEETARSFAVSGCDEGAGAGVRHPSGCAARRRGGPDAAAASDRELAGNAIKFTDRGEVVLHVENEDKTNQGLSLAFRDPGFGHRHFQRQAKADLRGVRPGGQFLAAQIRRHRAGTYDFVAAGGDDGRPNMGRERTRAGKHISFHRALSMPQKPASRKERDSHVTLARTSMFWSSTTIRQTAASWNERSPSGE